MAVTQTASVPVFFTVDDHFVRPFLVACNSLLVHCTRVQEIVVLHARLAPVHRAAIVRLVEHHERTVRFVCVDARRVHRLPTGAQFASECYFRMFIHEYTDADVAAYFDSDLVVLQNIDNLFDAGAALDGCFAAAVKDTKASLGHQQRICADPANYHNSGLLLCNLRQMRTDDLSAQIQRLVATDFVRHIVFADQDILNRLFEGRWLSLPDRYNCIDPGRYDPKTVVLHFAGRRKPWHRNYRARPNLAQVYREAAGTYDFIETQPAYVWRRALERLEGAQTWLRSSRYGA